MKILIVSRGYPTEKYKMNGIFEFDQAKALALMGHEVIFAAVDVRSIRRWRKWGFESFKKDGVQVEAINLPGGRIPRKILSKMSTYGLNKLYKRIHKRYGEIDIVHGHFLNIGLTVKNVLGNNQIPLILTEHLSALNNKPIDTSLLERGKEVYPYFNEIITVSKPLANSLKHNFNINPIVIPNIVDTDIFRYYESKNNKKHYDFISIGGLIKRKGMDLLIKSFSKVFNSNNSVRLFIYGDGPERKNLEELIEEKEMEDNIFLMGLTDRKEIAEKMKESQCFVLASKLETFGVVYIEAMAMGLPVIATKCEGPEDFVNDENGILIPVDDSKELERALSKMYTNISKYDRKSIAVDTRERFAPKSIAGKITEVYEDLLKKILD